MKPKVTGIPYLAVKPLLFVASILLIVVITGLSFGESALKFLVYPLSCTLPIYFFLACMLKKKGVLGIVLPLLPLLVLTLIVVNWAYQTSPQSERSPQDIFKMYVVDPIPAGVTNIQGRYLEEGIFEDVVITFQASPEAVDTIIVQKQFERDDVHDNYIDPDLPEHLWKGNWIGYHRSFYESSGGLAGYIDMWFDPEQSTIILRVRR